MIDPVELAALPPDAQRDAVLSDLLAAAERALAVIPASDPLHAPIQCAASGLSLLVEPRRQPLRALPPSLPQRQSEASRQLPLLRLVEDRR